MVSKKAGKTGERGSKSRKKAVSKPNPERDQWPLVEAFALRTKQTGNHAMAVGDIQEALVGGELHSQRRNEVTGKFEDLTSEFWIENEFFYKVLVEGTLLLTIRPRNRSIWDPPERTKIPGHFFYVWRSDYEKLWSLEPGPSQAGKPAEKQTELSQGGKPGRKTTDKWKFHAAIVICRIVLEEDRKPTAKDISQVLDEKDINLTPDRSEINRLIGSLLRLLE
jgi:hypothetical protein